MKIPDSYRAKLISKPDLSVASFLSIDIPAKCTTLVGVTASKQFSSAALLVDPLCLKTQKLPSLKFATDAVKSIGQALLNNT
jgi:hypothetical protein